MKPTAHRDDIRLIVSALQETDEPVCESVEIAVESNKANYNVDLGFVSRNGAIPAGTGEGQKQLWTGTTGDDN